MACRGGVGNLSSRRRLTDDERERLADFVAKHWGYAVKLTKYNIRRAPMYVQKSSVVADIATDALIVAFLNHDGRSKERTHIARQVFWYASAEMKREKRRLPRGLTNKFVDEIVTDDGWKSVDSDDFRERLLPAISPLARVIISSLMDGLTFAEMQPKLGLSKGGVYSRFTSAIDEVCEFFQRQRMEIA